MAKDEYRCFIGGLSDRVDDRELKETFSTFGEVTEATVIKDWETGVSKGFGFGTFKKEECMREAIEVMNGIRVSGQKLSVQVAKSQRRERVYNWDMEDLSRKSTQKYERQTQLTEEESKMIQNMEKLFGLR